MKDNRTKVIVVFRNDDLCAWSDPKHEAELLRLFNDFKIPVTLGVIPQVRGWSLDDNREILRLLERAQSDGHELALHGFLHDHHEFERLPIDELSRRLEKGQKLMQSWFGQTSTSFIPPDNAWTLELLRVLTDNGFGLLSSGMPLLPLPTDGNTDNLFIADAIVRFLFTPLVKTIGRLTQYNLSQPVPVVVYFHSWEVRQKVHWERMEILLRSVAENPNVIALTFTEALQNFSDALKAWVEWRKDAQRVDEFNRLFKHRTFYKARILHRYWRDWRSRGFPVPSLEDWLAEVFCAAILGDVDRMRTLITQTNRWILSDFSLNSTNLLGWIPLLAVSGFKHLVHPQPPRKMEDALRPLQMTANQTAKPRDTDISTNASQRSLLYLSFDRNIVSEHAAMTSKALVKRGWRVILVHPHSAQWSAAPEGIRQFHVGSGKNGLKGIWDNQKEMAQLIAQWQPPVIYARQHWQGLLPPLVAKRLGISYVAEFNGLRHRGILSRQPNSAKGLLIRQLERWCAQWSTSIVVPSISLAKRIAQLVGNAEIHNLTNLTNHTSPITLHASRITHHIFVVPNGIDPEVFRPIPQEEARRQLGLPTDGLYVAYTGSLHHWQGVDVLLRAFALLIPKFPNCRLLIVGGQDEPNKDAYKKLAQELRITDYAFFVPFVPYEQSALYIAAGDVCVAPYLSSYCEHGGGSPLKLYAYLSCARPVILSDLGEFVDADLVRSSQSGLLVQPGDPEALAEAISVLLSDPTLRAEMGQRGREAILNGYTWEHNAMRVERVLESVMRKA